MQENEVTGRETSNGSNCNLHSPASATSAFSPWLKRYMTLRATCRLHPFERVCSRGSCFVSLTAQAHD